MKINEWLQHKKWTQRQLAEKVGCKEPHMSLICNGHALPSLKLALKIDKVTHQMVRPNDWGVQV